MRPIPVQNYLTPEPEALAPEGFTTIETPILRGLPHRFPLNDHIFLNVLLPNGLAHEWRDADPEAVVSASEDEREALAAAQLAAKSEVSRPALRLMVEYDNVLQESVAVVAGHGVCVPNTGSETRGVKLELIVLSWRITAGSMRSLGDYGSRVRLAWRERGKGSDTFALPAINPNLVPRLEREQVFFSNVVQPAQYYSVVYSSAAVEVGG